METCFCCKGKANNTVNVRGLLFCSACGLVVWELITPKDGIREIGNLVRSIQAIARASKKHAPFFMAQVTRNLD